MNVEQRITTKIKEYRITQIELANKTGLSKTAINNYCTGKQEPNTQALYKLAIALDVSMEWLLTGEDRTSTLPASPWELNEDQRQTANVYFPDLTEEQVALLNNFEKLDARDKGEIKAMIRFKLEGMMGLSSSSEGHNGASGIA